MAATYTLISSQVLGSTATSVTFSSIPQTYTDLKLVCSTRDTTSGSIAANIVLTINGDTATNYSSIVLRGNGGTVSSQSYATNNSFQINNASTGSASTANTFGNNEFYFPNYTVTGTKQNLFIGGGENNATTAWTGITASLYRGTAAITSITYTLDTTLVMAIGSSFYLYGIKNA
jgi:hypothetical protein